MPGPKPTSRYLALDGLRGLAALSVVFYHYWFHGRELYPEIGTPVHLAAYGQKGVQVFFVISGLVIAMSLDRLTIRQFAIRRFIRLYPTYWAALALTLTVVAVWGLPGREVSGPTALLNVTMVQGLLNERHVDGSYWTLGVELVFYVTGALLWAASMMRGRRIGATLLAWLGACVVAQQLIPADHPGWVQVFNFLPSFLAGIALFRIIRGDRWIELYAIPVLAAVQLGIHDNFGGLSVLAACAVVYGVTTGPTFGLASAPLRFLGRISYPLYLIHQNIGYVLMLAFASVGLAPDVAAAITVVIVIAAATLITLLFDEPIRRFLTRHLLSKNRRSAATLKSGTPQA